MANENDAHDDRERGDERRSCVVCGAPEEEVGPEVGSWSTCPLRDEDDDFELVGEEWEKRNCLDGN